MAPAPALPMQNASRCCPYTGGGETDIIDKQDSLELTVLGGPFQTGLFGLNYHDTASALQGI